jgi:hypothetical protein
MTSQRTPSQSTKPTVMPCILGFALIVLFGNVDALAAQLTCPLGSTTNRALEVLDSLAVSAIALALQSCILDQQQLLQGFTHILLSLWLLLFTALVLRMVFAGTTGAKTEDHSAPGNF